MTFPLKYLLKVRSQESEASSQKKKYCKPTSGFRLTIMYIKTLQLKNFRNYSDFSLDLKKGLNFIIGKNATGKTNILEAIYFLEAGKSHRTNTNQELIIWNEEFSLIKASTYRQDRDIIIEASIFKAGGKQIKVNGVEIKKIRAGEKPILTVIFTPDHLKIVKEMPEHRRSYLDEILEKTRPDYGYWRQQYSKILKQRNMLLKKVYVGRMKQDVIDYWDKQLVRAGVKIVIARAGIIKKLEDRAGQSYKKISESDMSFELNYENQLLDENNNSPESLEERFLSELKNKRKAEIERGQTLVGPHRDDVGIYAGGIDLRIYGSQGEQRSASLALKIAEFSIIKELSKDLPILLLDDVMSELDHTRREALLKQVGNGIQAIITSTHVEYLKGMDEMSANVVTIS